MIQIIGSSLASEYITEHNIGSSTPEFGTETRNTITSTPLGLTNHSLIRIDDDTDFNTTASAENWTGNGSVNNPYIIENYFFNGTGEGFCVYIGNTTAHFIIRNCSVNNASGNYVSYKWNTGIVIYNSINGSVENNTFNNNDFIGLLLYYSDNSQVNNNTLNGSTYGIYLLRSTNNYVYNNSVFNTSTNGIYLVNSGNTTIDKNYVTNNFGSGIRFSNSPPPMVTGETIDQESNIKNDHTEDTLLFKLAPSNFPTGQSEADFINELTSSQLIPGVVDISHYPHVGLYKMQLDLSISVENALKILSLDPRIQYAEPDFIMTLDAIKTPNDAKYSFLWGLNNSGQTGGTADADIDAAEAWTISNGSSDIVVAVIDTGVDYNHPDLTANMWKNPNETVDGIDNDGNGYIDDIYGIDAYNDDSDPMDDHSHGTHCSGTIGGVGNNSIGVVGVNWNVSIMALKFISKFNSGPTSDAIETINYMIMMKENGTNIKVSSNSWGGGGFSKSLYDAIEKTRRANIIFIAASGNDYSDTDITPHYPSSYNLTNVLSVAATDHNDNRAAFSNWGAHSVDVAAPGVRTYSTILSNGYGNKSGTSMATPHTAGLAALIAATNSTMNYNELKNLIMTTVDPLPALKEEMIAGGRINAYNALTYVPSGMQLYIQNPGNNSNLIRNTPVSVTASVTDGIHPITNAVLNVTFDNGDPLLRLLDNGKGSDQVAGDGYYTGRWVPKGPISIVLTINATAPGLGSEEKQIVVNIIDSNIISNNTIMSNKYGIRLITSTSNIIENNLILDSTDTGLYLEYSTYNHVNNNTCSNNEIGIEITDGSYNNQILNNIIDSNYYNGIYISPFSGGYTVIKTNTIRYNDQDILNEYPAVWVSSDKNQVIDNNISNNNGSAIYLFEAFQTQISNNTLINNPSGLYLNHSMNTKIFDNKMTSCGIFMAGSEIKQWNTHAIDTTNTVNKKPIIYLKDQLNRTAPAGAGEIILANCTNISVTAQYLSRGSVGLLLGFTQNSYIYNNYFGFNNLNGVYITNSSSNNVTNNSFVENRGYGVVVTQNSSNNSFSLNIFSNNSGADIYTSPGSSSVQAYDDGMNNRWNNTSGEGNYWSDYTLRYPNASNDGRVWNISYKINGSALAEDHYPLCNCTDYWTPIITDLTQRTGTTGDEHKFIVKVLDLFKITNVTVYYWFGSVVIDPKNTTMSFNSSLKTYELTIVLPEDSIQPLNYNISAGDSKSNWNSTGVRSVIILDNDSPHAIAGPDIEIYPGESVKFNGSKSSDNIGIINITWHFVYNGFDVYRYSDTFDFVFDLVGEYTVDLTVQDAEGFTDVDSVRINVLNKTRPKIFDLTYPSTADISENIMVTVQVIDISGLGSVMINYTNVSGLFNNVTMTYDSGDKWSFEIPGQDNVGTVTFFVYAANIYGNLTKTIEHKVNIIDLIIPEISNIIYPSTVEINERMNISAKVFDNAGLSGVKLVYTGVNNTVNNISMLIGTRVLPGIKYNSIIPGQDQNGTVRFHIWVTDMNGNINRTPEFKINVIQRPQVYSRPNIYSVIPSDGANLRFDTPIKVVAKVNDSSGVAAVYLNYTVPGGTNYNKTMESIGNETYTFDIPSLANVGTMSFYITAKNSLDIWNRTTDHVIYLVYVPPPDNEPPFVRTTIPENESVDVDINTTVTIIFNESMLPNTVESAITITPEVGYTSSWGGEDTNSELTITFVDVLDYNTTYKITIGTRASDFADNRMVRPFILTFQTIAPAIPPEKDWDKDKDGMNDTWEVNFGLNPLINDSAEDPDKDGYTNLEEYLANTDPTDPKDHPKDIIDGDDSKDEPSQYLQLAFGLIILIIIVVIITILLVMRQRKSQEYTADTEQSEDLDEEAVPYKFESEEDVGYKDKDEKEKDEYERIYGVIGSSTTYNKDIEDEDVNENDEEIEWDDE
jgi:parallel beta-helix repeat protein